MRCVISNDPLRLALRHEKQTKKNNHQHWEQEMGVNTDMRAAGSKHTVRHIA
jgi:hypothetical protein